MKTRYAFTAAVFALLASCNLKEQVEMDTGYLSIRIIQPQTRVSFAQSDGKLSWDNGDKIAIHLGSSYVERAVVPDGTNPVIGKVSSGSPADDYDRNGFAVYPSSCAVAEFYGNPALKVNLPDTYDISAIVAGTSDLTSDYALTPMIAINRQGMSVLSFFHVGGLLRLSISGVVSSTKQIKVTLDKDVTGVFSVIDAVTETPSINTSTLTDRNTVTFTVSDTTPVGPESRIVLNIPVPCGTYNTIRVETMNASGTSLAFQTVENLNLTVDRHQGKRMGIGSLSFDFAIASPIEDIHRTGSDVIYNYSETINVTVNNLAGASVTAAPWQAYFATTSAAIGSDVSPSWSTDPLLDANGNSWLTLTPKLGSGATNVVVSLKSAPFTTAPTVTPSSAASAEISSLTSGTGANGVDLSTYNIITRSSDSGSAAETANCYVIQKYGSYLIPCVYGNAITAGGNNAAAYHTSNTGSVLQTLVNADGNPIGASRILDDPNLIHSSDLVARVLWQDTQPGCEILTDEDLVYHSDLGTSAVSQYIRVNFPKAKIKPGNVVIALYDRGNSKILWSWHLWVTSKSLAVQEMEGAYPFYDHAEVLDAAVGWTPPISYSAGATSSREQYVIIASSTGKVVDSFKVSQDAYSLPASSATSYSATYYQWGRKDPFLPSSGSTSNQNKSISNSGDFPAFDRITGTLATTEAGTSPTGRLAEMIRAPYAFFSDLNNYPEYYNLWNMVLTTSGNNDDVCKTVYDPSPRGFHVPRRHDFSGTTGAGGYGSIGSGEVCGQWLEDAAPMPAGFNFSSNNGWVSTTYILYFPCLGVRNEDGVLDEVSANGNYWSTTPHFAANAFFLDFGAWGVNPQQNNLSRVYGFTIRPVRTASPGS